AGQRPAGGQRRWLRIGGPFRIDLEDRSSFCRKAFTKGLPEAGPVLQVAVEDRAARRVVQIEPAGKASAQDGGGGDRLARLHPEVAAGLPAVARFEATPCPGLQQRCVGGPRNERVPGGRILAGRQLGHPPSAERATRPRGGNPGLRTLGASYLAWASIGKKSRGGGGRCF